MPAWPVLLAWVAALAVAGWALDRALVACELRGWMTYRLTPRPRHEIRRAAGSMLIGVDGLFRPAARHVAGVIREAAVHREGDAEGDAGRQPCPQTTGSNPPGDDRLTVSVPRD